jgi:radical SAM superfamily enzyme YgiQ (UPF0313 family)
MKVLLISPPTSFEQIYGEWDLTGLDTHTPPLGLLHIASYIREAGHDPAILDLLTIPRDFKKITEHILTEDPDVVGLSAMTINCLNADKIARALRDKGFTAPIVIGGAHVSAVPVETLKRFEAIDYGVIGEGEITFLDLLTSLQNNSPVNGIAGLVWRDKGQQIVINSPRPPIENLDMLPLPAWDLLDGFPAKYPHSLLESKRIPAAAIMTSRGCPFDCTFCDHRVFGSKVRHFSADYTLAMIRHLIEQYGVRDLMVLDDNFLVHTKKLMAICDAMIAEKLDLTWYCIAHAKSVSEEKATKIRETGCWFIELGIESGNDDILKSIKKNTSKAEFARAATVAKKAGLMIKGNFIFGFPGETRETLEETIRFALDSDIHLFQQNFLTVWPGCEIYDDLSKVTAEYEYYQTDWSQLAHQRVTFVPKGMTKQDLVRASKDANRRFYLRPKIVLGLLPHLASLRGIKFGFVAFRVFLGTIFRKS